MGGGRTTATMDWNSLRYYRMNSKQLRNMFLGYLVAICMARPPNCRYPLYIEKKNDTAL